MNGVLMVRVKRGELTSSQIVAIVLAIAGFVVVLFFLAIIYGGSKGQDQREICRLSILTRATTPHAAQAAVPIACTTEKICVSMSGAKDACPQFLGEENVFSVKLDGKTEESNARLIEKTSAEAMYYCWSMTGKGQLDLFGTAGELFLGSQGKATCIICSRIAYATDINDSILNQVNLKRYLETERVPISGSSLTYLEAFTDRDVKSFASLQTARPNDALNLNPEDKEPLTISGTPTNRQIAFVFSQVKTVKVSTALKNLGYAVVGSTFALSQVPLVGKLGGRTAGAILTNPYGIAATVVASGAVIGGVSWNAYQGQRAAAGYCGALTTAVENKDLKEGCSLVQAVNYNVPDINAICPTIQGNP